LDPNGVSGGDQLAVSQSERLRITQGQGTAGTTVLVLSGELDIESAQTLADLLRTPPVSQSRRVVLDLSGLEFIDSTGISVLVKARLQAGQEHRAFVLTKLPARVERILNICGIGSRFTIV
jgi:anti-anti-sigma factor